MSDQDKKEIIDVVVAVIREELPATLNSAVNGKLDRLDKKLETHIEDMKPIMDLIEGSIVFKSVFLWFTTIIVGGVGAYLAVKNVFK